MPNLFSDFNPFQRVASNQYGMVGKTIGRGSLIAFHYPVSWASRPNIIHDPYPLVIVTDIWPRHLRGVNLHYLAFPFIKNILQANCGNSNFSYYNVKPDRYIANAFRMYYRQGMSQVKMMDCSFLLNVLGAVRSWSESEIEAVKNEIQSQIRSRLQTKAQELTQASQEQLQPQAFNPGQNRAIRDKAGDIQQALQGGVLRGLTYPEPNQAPLPRTPGPVGPTNNQPEG